MVIAIFGASCTRKSVLAEHLRLALGARSYAGKDYLRPAKDATEAECVFAALLREHAAAAQRLIDGFSRPALLKLLPDGRVRVRVNAPLDVIQTRFAACTGSTLPPPAAAMPARRHGMFGTTACDLAVDDTAPAEESCAAILRLPEERTPC